MEKNRNRVKRSGTDVMILKIFSLKKFEKKLAQDCWPGVYLGA
jgi:hypothetical protein